MENIILIGFMGSGKTTFGKWLSKHMQYQFMDTDEYIVKNQKKTIPDIFRFDGENYFRNLETRTLQELLDNSIDHHVVSVGGGLPVKDENRTLLKQLGKVVYLRATCDTLEKRLKNDTDRPLLKGSNLREKIEYLTSQRENFYLDAADVIIDTDSRSFDEMYKVLINTKK